MVTNDSSRCWIARFRQARSPRPISSYAEVGQQSGGPRQHTLRASCIGTTNPGVRKTSSSKCSPVRTIARMSSSASFRRKSRQAWPLSTFKMQERRLARERKEAQEPYFTSPNNWVWSTWRNKTYALTDIRFVVYLNARLLQLSLLAWDWPLFRLDWRSWEFTRSAGWKSVLRESSKKLSGSKWAQESDDSLQSSRAA